MKDLKFDLLVGYKVKGNYTKSIELLRSNSIAEEVFTRKLAEKPFTWIANVISIATKSIGSELVGEAVRDEYLKSGSVTIPSIVKQMPLTDANMLLLEIHRRVWESKLPKQQIVCKFCTKGLVTDIDLDQVQAPAEALNFPQTETLFTDLDYGVDLTKWIIENKQDKEGGLSDLKDINFNRLIFRIPTLGDGIKNEDHASRSIDLWRRIAADCLIGIQSVEDDKIVAEFPTEKIPWLGLKFFTYFDSSDLKKIRFTLREELPTMPFSYMGECPCDFKRTIPFAMEASGFFSE